MEDNVLTVEIDDPELFEPDPHDLTTGIKIRGLKKVSLNHTNKQTFRIHKVCFPIDDFVFKCFSCSSRDDSIQYTLDMRCPPTLNRINAFQVDIMAIISCILLGF